MTTNTNTMITDLHDAIAAANARGDEHYAGVSASRGQGSATPHWLTIDDLQTVIDEIEDGEDWYVVEDEDEIADIAEDVKMLVEDIDQAERVTVLRGNFVAPSDPREYVVVWAYDAVKDAAAAMGRKGGKSKSAAKVAAARKNAAKARAAVDPAKQAAAVAASNRRRAKK